jgi:hypothetical protein
VADDILVVVLGLVALASMLVMSTTVNIGFKTQSNLPNTIDASEVHVKVYVSTILFVLVTNLSKLPVVLWLMRLESRTVYRAAITMIGLIFLACMVASTAGVIFLYRLPNHWGVRRGEQISLVGSVLTKHLSEQSLIESAVVLDYRYRNRHHARSCSDRAAFGCS